MEVRDLETAQHEAAHVVIGVALGLRMRVASIGPWPGHRGVPADPDTLGYADFFETRGDGTAQAIMLAAGIAWDRGLRFPRRHSASDWAECMKIVRGRKSVEACVLAAAAMLAGRAAVHARVTRALLHGDLTGAEIAELMER